MLGHDAMNEFHVSQDFSYMQKHCNIRSMRFENGIGSFRRHLRARSDRSQPVVCLSEHPRMDRCNRYPGREMSSEPYDSYIRKRKIRLSVSVCIRHFVSQCNCPSTAQMTMEEMCHNAISSSPPL